MKISYGLMARYLFALFITGSASLHGALYTGFTTATFSNPDVPCSGAITCTGLGTSEVTWGEPSGAGGVSRVTFTPAPFDVDAGVLFTLGTLTLENRTIVPDTSPDFFTLTITFHITNQDAQSTYRVRMRQVSTSNVGDPITDADWITLYPDLAEMAFFVYEGSGESVRLMTAFAPTPDPPAMFASADAPEYRIEPIRFGEVLGPNGFVGPSPDIPEASTGVLTSSAVLLLAAGMKWRNRSRQTNQS